MTIDKAIKLLEQGSYNYVNSENFCKAYDMAIDTMRKYQMMQADYENRLKADMVAMLTDLKNKLIDKSWNIDMYDDDLDFECCYLTDIDEIIQQKINALKANRSEN